MKTCSKCQKEKSITDYQKAGYDKQKKLRYRAVCKTCQSEIRKSYPSASKENQKKQHEKLKEWKAEYYQKK